MSSTQHQLIEQCATRLRGIVEALDNIHDNTPHRWSTDLDDVHSSAESLLALIKDQAPARSEASFEEWLANELEGEDGQPVPAAACDITLARRAFNHWPKLEQPAKVGGVRFSAGVSSRLVVEAAQRLYEFESTPEKEAERIDPEQESVEQAGGDERAACNLWIAEQQLCQGSDISLFKLERNGALVSLHELLRDAYQAGQARAALAQPSPKCATCNDSGQIVVSGPHYQGEFQPPEYETEPCDMCAQPSPAQAEQAEVERPEVVARVDGTDEDWFIQPEDETELHNEGLLFAGCELGRMIDFDRIVGELRADRDSWAEQAEQRLADWDEMRKERDAALARVAELERQEPVALANRGLHAFWVKWTEAAAGLYGPGIKLYAAPVAQAQHSVPDVCDSKEQNAFEDWASKEGMNMERHPLHWLFLDAKTYSARQGWKAALKYARNMLAAAPVFRLSRSALTEAQMRRLYENSTETENERLGFEAFARLIRRAEAVHQIAAAPGKEVPQAWLDVQAERRRQVEAEGWTPEHDDEHSHGQMARASACYALAGSSAPNDGTAALLVSLAWPWDEQWWKPSTARRDLVKACALVLAEIERLDRAAASQGGPSDA
ncbi:hypothetical protein N0573_00645 [Pseudomonas aeruginosa]|nr:hypothetical protein [Pseudomonas aeruginosa]MCT0490488.1 hypothetical protein [Pseudomonas aeruginosa]